LYKYHFYVHGVEGKKKDIHSVQVFGSNDNREHREHMAFLIDYFNHDNFEGF